MRITLAFLCAILTPTLMICAWYLYGQFEIFPTDDPYIWVRTRNFLFSCLAVAGAYVVVLGVPTFLILRKLHAIRWWSTTGAGFILGAVPIAILTWPLQYSGTDASATVDGVQTMINGIPTTAGWVQYASGFSFFGACGSVAALAFWIVSRHEPQQRAPEDAFKATRL